MATATTPGQTARRREYTNLEQAIGPVSFLDALAKFFPSRKEAEALQAEVLNQARKNPDLHECTIDSVRHGVVQLARWRLSPALPNEVALIPRGKRVQDDGGKWNTLYEMHTDLGYGGLRKLAMRSPEVTDVIVHAVCVNDTFRPPQTIIGMPVHIEPDGFAPRGRVLGYFAAIAMANGHWRYLGMRVAEVEAHAARYVQREGRDGKKYFPKGPWGTGKRPDVEEGLTEFDKMGMKTVLRMALNARDMALTTDVAEALHAAEVLDEALRMPTAAEAQGYDREGQRANGLSETERAKTREQHEEDIYGPAQDPTRPALPEGRQPDVVLEATAAPIPEETPSRWQVTEDKRTIPVEAPVSENAPQGEGKNAASSTPPPPPPQGAERPMDSFEFWTRLEALCARAGYSSAKTDQLKEYILSQKGGQILPQEYGPLLARYTELLTPALRTEENGEDAPSVEGSSEDEALIGEEDTQTMPMPFVEAAPEPTSAPTPTPAPEPDPAPRRASWRLIEAYRGDKRLQPATRAAIEALYAPNAALPSDATVAQVTEQIRHDVGRG